MNAPEHYSEAWIRRQIRMRRLLAIARTVFAILGVIGWAILAFGGDFHTGVILVLCSLTWLILLTRE